jgi:hypothetical protein
MVPGPTHIIACPSCGGLHQQLTFMSGNAFGARRWTDGKVDAPMYPVTPRFISCVHCHGSFFIEEARVIGDIPFGPDSSLAPPEWQNAPRILWPHIEDYKKRLAQAGADNPERVRYLRMHLWWALNDILHSRNTPSFKSGRIDNPVPGKQKEEYEGLFRENLEALSGMLSDSAQDITVKAEIMRELGKFDDAIALLPASYALSIHDLIRERAAARDATVSELSIGS